MTVQPKMGIRASKRSQSQKQQIEKVVDHVTTQNKSKLAKLKQTVQQTAASSSENENAIVTSSNLDVAKQSMLRFIEIANQQLDKKGSNLIKTDLLAIVINLEPTSNIDELNKLSIPDLNAMIRNIIYDPIRCEKRFQQSCKQLETSNLKSLK